MCLGGTDFVATLDVMNIKYSYGALAIVCKLNNFNDLKGADVVIFQQSNKRQSR